MVDGRGVWWLTGWLGWLGMTLALSERMHLFFADIIVPWTKLGRSVQNF